MATPYYVLGYKDNPIIKEFQKQYFIKLQYLLKDMIWGEHKFFSLKNDAQASFLLQPDYSSLVMNFLYKKDMDFKKKLLDELDKYINWKIEWLTSNLWNKIAWTDIYLTVNDLNPENQVVWHPDQDQDGMIWWWEKTEAEWNEVFSKAFDLLKKINIDFYYELNHIISKIVPMQTALWVHNSASYKDCIWSLYLWYTIDEPIPELCILEALIHESSHNKINLILQSEKIMLNDNSLIYYSPYRPDARPMHWVYLWVHAIVPTVYVMLQAIDKWYITEISWFEKVIMFHIKNKLWFKVIQKYGKLTKTGTLILWELLQIIKMSDEIINNSEKIKHFDIEKSKQRARDHFLNVKNNYSYLHY